MFDERELTAYLAAEGYEEQLALELGEFDMRYERLFVTQGPPRKAHWAANIWLDPRVIEIGSIGSGAKALRAIQRNWVHYPVAAHGRARLLEEKLPHFKSKLQPFPLDLPTAPIGAWCLIDNKHMLASPHCSSPFPDGEIHFIEDHMSPPNRAYLKLWEALTVLGERPEPGDRCLDLGSSPGGWTWVLQQLGAKVVSVDKAPLHERIAQLPRIDFRQESAFGLEPSDVGPVEWLCCDIACYPERLFKLVQRWLESGLCPRFICTLKFQGEPDYSIADQFAAIEGSRLLHLHHNKHELTFLLTPPAP
jgi:23S rRNA (cytidine2498-2'-O)-methyltransferase